MRSSWWEVGRVSVATAVFGNGHVYSKFEFKHAGVCLYVGITEAPVFNITLAVVVIFNVACKCSSLPLYTYVMATTI